jgi:uncharacterized protein
MFPKIYCGLAPETIEKTMTHFECTLCGKCCMHAGGDLVEIERKLSGRDFLCRQRILGGTFRARVEDRFLDIFADTRENAAHPTWCPFLRPLPDQDGRYVCTIHSSRPVVCRSYICCTVRIYQADGTEAGKVKGRRSLSTEDSELRRIWDEAIGSLGIDDDIAWRKAMISVLNGAGYRLEVYE